MQSFEGLQETSLFIKNTFKYWKILDRKSKSTDIRYTNKFERVVSDKTGSYLNLEI